MRCASVLADAENLVFQWLPWHNRIILLRWLQNRVNAQIDALLAAILGFVIAGFSGLIVAMLGSLAILLLLFQSAQHKKNPAGIMIPYSGLRLLIFGSADDASSPRI